MKATFFVNGDNFGKISDRKIEVQRMLSEGHQIGSHTFRHPDLANISEAEVRTEMTLLDAEVKKLIGKTPTYMRPPFFSTSDEVLRILGEMQYHVINADIDTKDFENTKPETNDKSFQNFKNLFGKGSISLMHDVHNTTVNQLIPNVIPFLQKSGKTSMTVGECLGDPKENWYRENKIGGTVVQGPVKKQPAGKSCGCNARKS
ncbi:Chitin deacetylase [Metarhizium brunneum]|uniref:Chitin deacetylase n=1 Tax=Metarhizium brunneum TaxID=500148 RepID=A0A7D5ZBP3_9HYPO|nr:Chitin deacetylase [Metarhizium brunneum]